MEERDMLMMAALIASVRTARFPTNEFQGMSTPRVIAEISSSIWIAQKICSRVDQENQANRISHERELREASNS